MNFTNLLTFAEEQRIALMNHTTLIKNHHPHRRKRYSACSNRLNKGREQRRKEPSHEEGDNCLSDVEHHRALERIESYGDAEHEFSMSQYKSSSSRSLGSSSLSRTPSIPTAIEKCPSEPIIIARANEYADEGTKELERYFELKTNRMQERRRRSFQLRQGLQNAEWLVEENTRSTFFLNHEVLALDD